MRKMCVICVIRARAKLSKGPGLDVTIPEPFIQFTDR